MACDVGTKPEGRANLRASFGGAKVFASREYYRGTYEIEPADVEVKKDVFANIAKQFFTLTDAEEQFVNVETNGPAQTPVEGSWQLTDVKVEGKALDKVIFIQQTDLVSIEE